MKERNVSIFKGLRCVFTKKIFFIVQMHLILYNRAGKLYLINKMIDLEKIKNKREYNVLTRL